MSAVVLHGDCLEVLASQPSNSVDLVLADPPYGQTQNKWDAAIPFVDLWAALWRVCTPEASVVMTAMQPFSSALVMSQVENFRHEWVWEKNKASGHLNAKRGPMRAHELVLIFCRQQPRYFPQMTEGHKPGNKATRRTYTPNYGAQKPTDYGGQTVRYPRSVQQFDILNNDSPEKVHPTQKPVELMEYLVRTYSAPGDSVLDFSAGSGTTGVACVRLNRRFIGIEMDQNYAQFARSRVEAEALLA